jgi:rod shape-determining protein MreC
MESFFSRYRNEWVLVTILFVQLIALATQVRVPAAPKGSVDTTASVPDPNSGGTRLIRVWAEALVSPFQKLAVNSSHGVRHLWTNYIDLRGVRKENEQLRKELTELRFQQAQTFQDAEQGRRLQALLDFRQQFIHKTVAAQVIGTSGTELSRVIYIDRGTKDGVQPGMAVVTSDGVVGKISRADGGTSQVLLISDPQSGAGVLLERLHLNGILKGTSGRYPEMQNVMSDEKLQVGDHIVTTGGDRVFPRGLPVGTVESFLPDKEKEPFLSIKVKPAADLGKLAEVLVITEMTSVASSMQAEDGQPLRAADVLAERLPSVKKKTDQEAKAEQKAAASQPATDTVPAGVDTSAVPTDASGKPVEASKKPTSTQPDSTNRKPGTNTPPPDPTQQGQPR